MKNCYFLTNYIVYKNKLKVQAFFTITQEKKSRILAINEVVIIRTIKRWILSRIQAFYHLAWSFALNKSLL